MVAELVETSRLWGRTAAQIQPSWIEPLAAHLLKCTYEAPHWERKRGSVVATERATLFGLPVVAGRKVAYGAIDPELSRELFIRCALVEGDWQTRHEFVAENARVLEELEELEHRARRRDILAGDEAIFAFYDARIPADVVSAAHFDRWWKAARRARPGAAELPARPARRRRRRGGPARPPRAAGHVAPGRPRARAELPLRAGRRARRRHRRRSRCTRSRSCAPTASTGSCRGCATSSSSR